MKSTEEILKNMMAQTMREFDFSLFKNTHPTLLLAIQKSMIAYKYQPDGVRVLNIGVICDRKEFLNLHNHFSLKHVKFHHVFNDNSIRGVYWDDVVLGCSFHRVRDHRKLEWIMRERIEMYKTKS